MRGYTGLILGLLIGVTGGLVYSNFQCMSLYDWIFAIVSLLIFCIGNYLFLESAGVGK